MTLTHSQPDLLALDGPASPPPAARPASPARPASHRDPTVDAVRAGALLIVVVLHALMVGAQIAPTGALRTSVALSGEAWFVPMTWVLQIMPLFFIAGGFASLSQWRRMRERGASAAEYVTARTRRLAVPAILMIGSVGGALLLARALGADAALIDEASLRIGQPLWFLATYFGVTALVPAMAWLHDRIPLITVLALAVGVIIVDVAHARLGAPVGYLNLVLVWPLMQQLGFLMRDGLSFAVWRRRGLITGLLASLALLLALIGRGWSPDMLVNLNPPTTAIMLLGTAQFFVLQLLRPRLDSLTRAPRLTRVISRANAVAMGVYLWHMPVVLGLVALMWSAGLPLPAPHSEAWWATRPLWLLVIGCCVLPVAACIAPLEQRIVARLQATATATATGFGSRAGMRGMRGMRGMQGWSASLSVLCGIGGTASALLAGIASPLPYAAALALLALGLHFATLRPRLRLRPRLVTLR
ncbi:MULTISPECIES: acyltransferase [unclassified Leucobacter]|uniref:acyltransferase family protein n=1 Tax=unclassified Leucobacter TaxID=2621730 RepID=UPI0019073EE1